MPTKATTAVVNVQMIEERPDLIQDAVQYSILSGSDIATNIQAANLKRMSLLSERYYEYASTSYYYGLPSSVSGSSAPNIDAIQSILDTEYTVTSEIQNTFAGEASRDYLVKHWLKDNYHWQELSNNLYGADGITVVDTFVDYVDDEVLIHINGASGEIGTIPSPEPAHAHIMAYWHEEATPTVRHYWTYNTNDGTYPSLEAPDTTVAYDMYPIVPVRRDGVSERDAADLAPYNSSKTLLNKINIGIDDIIDSLEENEDVDDVNDAYIMFAIDLLSEDDVDKAYFHEFLKQLQTDSQYTKEDHLAALNPDPVWDEDEDEFQTPASTLILNKFKVLEDDFSLTVNYNYIDTETITGTVGDGTLGNIQRNVHIFSNEIREEDDDGDVVEYRVRSYVEFDLQVSATEIERVTLHGLEYEHIVTVTGADSGDRYHTSFLGDVDPVMLFPLARNVMTNLDDYTKETVTYNSLQLVVYAINKTHVEWYQTGFFAFFIQIVGIVLTVFTAGTSLIAAAAISAKIFILTALKIYIIAELTDYVVAWLFEELGSVGGVVAIIAVAFVTGKISFAEFMKSNLADKLMNAVTVVSDALSAYVKAEYATLAEEYGDWEAAYNTRLDELSESEDLLEDSAGLPAYMLNALYQPIFNANETPSQYFGRTIEDGNPGVATLNYADRFVGLSLELPEPDNYTQYEITPDQ